MDISLLSQNLNATGEILSPLFLSLPQALIVYFQWRQILLDPDVINRFFIYKLFY
jgi:hypothetical protein